MPHSRRRNRIPGDRAPKWLPARIFLLLRTPRRRRGFWYGLAIDLIWPVIMAFTRPIWRGGENVPRTGPVLLAANHISFADPITLTAFTLGQRRIPRYLARANLWQIPVVRWVMKGGRHVPVRRGTVSASDAYRAALESLADGDCLMVFPEGTYTKDPDGWPMNGKPGITKLALAAGVPVIPIAHWGTHEVLPPGGKLRLLPRKTVHIHAGPPVDLSDLVSDDPGRRELIEGTKRIMGAITEQLREIRGLRTGEQPAPDSPGSSRQPNARSSK